MWKIFNFYKTTKLLGFNLQIKTKKNSLVYTQEAKDELELKNSEAFHIIGNEERREPFFLLQFM